MPDIQPRTTDDILAVISARAKEMGDDFRIRIERRPTIGSPPKMIATLEGARAEHFSSPETWLPKLIGGGIVQLKAYHMSDPNTVVGMPCYTLDGTPINPNVSVVEQTDWKGPSIITYPEKSRNDQSANIAAPLPSDSPAPRVTGGNGEGGHPPSAAEMRLLAQSEAIRKAEMDLIERKRQMEVDALKREAERERSSNQERIRELERRIEERSKAPDGSDRFAELMMEMRRADVEARKADREIQMQLANSQAMQALEMAKLQSQQQIEMAKAQAESSKAAAESNKVLLEALLNKPAIDPAIATMIGKNDTSQLLASMSSMLTNTASQNLSMMGALMDMGLIGKDQPSKPEKKNMGLQLLEGLGKLLLAPRPGGAPGQPLFPQPQLAPAPAQVIQQTQPNPAAGPAVTPAVQPQAAPASAQTVSVPAGPTVLSQVVDAIKGRKASAKDIAETVLQHWNDPSILGALQEAEGDPRVLLDNILGEWLDDKDNRKFGGEIIKIVLEQGIASNIIPEESRADIPAIVKSFEEAE